MLGRSYRLVEYTSDWVLQQRTPTTDWEAQHLFTLQPRTLADFRPMCHYHQTSAESGFTKNTICSLATTAGRVTLSNQRLITHLATQRQEQPIKTSEAYSTILQERFGIGQRDADLVSRIVFAADRDRE
jgi:N-hydroxyarylamine O-acetyltransferase